MGTDDHVFVGLAGQIADDVMHRFYSRSMSIEVNLNPRGN